MKGLFSIFGYGLGHATRMEAIIREFSGDKQILASGDAYNYFLKKKYPLARINSFRIGNILNSFSWAQTLFENIDFPFNMIVDYNKIKGIIREFKPDFLLSDTEPLSLLVASALGLKNFFLSNILPIVHEYKNIPAKYRDPKLDSQEAVIRMVVEQSLKKSDLLLSPTIKSYEDGFKVKYTDLIVRKKPSEVKSPANLKNYFLVSFGGAAISREYYELILPLLKELKDEFFVVSTNHAVRRITNTGNLQLHPFLGNYLELLKGCKGVISLAGHSTISEALVYGKPIFVLPIENHVEQLTNAFLVKKEKVGSAFLYKEGIDVNKLRTSLKLFISNLEFYAERVRKRGFRGEGASECAGWISKT